MRRCWPEQLREPVAEAVVAETRHLDAATRRQVDAQLVAAGITGMGYRQAVACARKHAYEADRAGYVARGRTERKHRRVGLRPAPDTMAILTGYLPVEQAAACYAGLRRHAARLRAEGDERSQDQIMADTMVERLTGRARAEDLDIEVQITMPFDSLLDPDPPDSSRPGILDPGIRAGPRTERRPAGGERRIWSATGRCRWIWPGRSSRPARAASGGGGCSPPRAGS